MHGEPKTPSPELREYLASIGKKGGKKGGKARAKTLSKKERSDIARKGATAMWANRRRKDKKK